MSTPEETRLRAALVDIAQGGGWQGRYAQDVLDAGPAAPANAAALGQLSETAMQAYRRFGESLQALTPLIERLASCGVTAPQGDRSLETAKQAKLIREELRRQGINLSRVGGA